MGLDDFISTETAFVAAAAAAVFSPKTRETVRKGAVYGVAGALKAGDVVAGAARGAVRGVRGDDTAASNGAAPAARTTSRAPATSTRRRSNSGSTRSGARRAAASTKSAGSAAGS